MRTINRGRMFCNELWIGHKFKNIAFAFALVTATLVVVGSASSSVAQAASATPGITAKTITLGLLEDVTGSDSAGNNTIPGTMARIDYQNAHGGIYGRKIKVVIGDGESTSAGALAAARVLVQQDKVFGIMAGQESFFFGGADTYTTEQNVPVTGVGLDGPEWGVKSTKNLFDAFGSTNFSSTAVFTTFGNFFKTQRCASVATEAYGSIPSSVDIAALAGKSAVAVGLTNPLNDLSATLTSTDYSAQALNIKSSGADCVEMELAPPGVAALATAISQAGLNLKAVFSAVGYGTVTPTESAAFQGVDLAANGSIPVEANTPDVNKMMAALRQYAHFTGTDYTQPAEFGWIQADLMIQGLLLAGKNPTRDGFEKALHADSDYTAGGVLAGKVNLAQKLQGSYEGLPTAGDCIYVTKYVGTSYLVLNGTKPICGTLVK